MSKSERNSKHEIQNILIGQRLCAYPTGFYVRDLWERHSFNGEPQAQAAENFAYAYGSPLNDHSPTLDFSFKTNRELHIESAKVSEFERECLLFSHAD